MSLILPTVLILAHGYRRQSRSNPNHERASPIGPQPRKPFTGSSIISGSPGPSGDTREALHHTLESHADMVDGRRCSRVLSEVIEWDVIVVACVQQSFP